MNLQSPETCAYFCWNLLHAHLGLFQQGLWWFWWTHSAQEMALVSRVSQVLSSSCKALDHSNCSFSAIFFIFKLCPKIGHCVIMFLALLNLFWLLSSLTGCCKTCGGRGHFGSYQGYLFWDCVGFHGPWLFWHPWHCKQLSEDGMFRLKIQKWNITHERIASRRESHIPVCWIIQ
jgi:hypothetical protein